MRIKIIIVCCHIGIGCEFSRQSLYVIFSFIYLWTSSSINYHLQEKCADKLNVFFCGFHWLLFSRKKVLKPISGLGTNYLFFIYWKLNYKKSLKHNINQSFRYAYTAQCVHRGDMHYVLNSEDCLYFVNSFDFVCGRHQRDRH